MRRFSASIVAASSVVLGTFIGTSAPVQAATSPLSVTYGASAAVDVQRTPGYPYCSGSSFNSWSVTSTGNPISQTAHNDLNNTTASRVDLSSVSYRTDPADPGTQTAAPAVLKMVQVGGADDWALKMYLASNGTTELNWNSVNDVWTTAIGAGNSSFATGGVAYALYSGGFMHEGVGVGAGRFDIGTFLMINSTLPIGSTLNYNPSPTGNTCTSNRTRATAAALISGVDDGGLVSVTEAPPVIVDTLDFDGNGGTCSPTSKSGERGTWSTALTADNCSRPGFTLTGFATTPTMAAGSVYVPPGGPIYFGGSNRFYALWARPIIPPAAPTDVVAVAGRNKVTLSWKAPSDDGGASIIAYAAKATPSGRTCVTRLNVDVNMLSCELFLPATNTKYTFTAQALNAVGWGAWSAASNAVSPYDFREVSGSRENVLFGLAGTKVQARGVAPGLAGLAVTPEFKVGAAAEWSREANAAKVNADGNFSWSKSFPASANKQNVSVRFTYGGDAVSDTLVMARGATVGSLSAPRNVKVENKVNEPIVTWDAPKFDGGSKVTEYQVCLQSPGSATGCVRAWESPRKVWDLRPGLYTVTVAAKNAKGFGPAAKASKPFRVTRASIYIDSRTDKDVIADVRYNGFAQGTKLTVEVAYWERGTSSKDASFVKSGTVTVSTVGQGSEQLTIPLRRGEEKSIVRLRLVTPNGEAYSQRIWGATQ